MKKTALAAALFVITGAANAAVVTSMTITGGAFNMGTTNLGVAGCQIGGFGSHQCITSGSTIDTDDGLFEGSASSSLVGLSFFGSPVNAFTAATATGAQPSITGNPLSGDATGSVLTMDVGSWYANWSGTNFLQGPTGGMATGTYDSTTGAFTLSWSSLIVGGPFNGQIGNWNLVGTVTAVPVPAAAWLFGSGLLGLAGVARRRMAA
ncbi:MAG: VPLPA-CTERM sorting domain-containing protein [Gammaproteobacteria bacterium]|nr:VPLPA-CTERM sorting domain-containing protein [Gammaproteobacteria bacterium]